MLSVISRKGKYCLLPLAGLFDADNVKNVTKTEQEADRITVKKETGWQRLERMFTADEFGNISNEANSILQVGAMSIFIGSMFGGIVNSRSAYLEFMRTNEATSFQSHFEAKRKLQDAVTISFGKGAFKWGWRLTLFSTSFAAISTIIQVYRGKYGISEYVIAGGMTGALYKFNMGPRGWIVGAGLGSVLGLFCGGCTLWLLKLAGISMDEARYWQHSWKHGRTEYFRKGMVDFLEREDYAVIRLHNDEVGEKGKDIANLDAAKSNEETNENSK